MGLAITVLDKNAEPMTLVQNISYGRWADLCEYAEDHHDLWAFPLAPALEAVAALSDTGRDPIVFTARRARLIGRLFLSAAPAAETGLSDSHVHNLAHWLGRTLSHLGDTSAVEIG